MKAWILDDRTGSVETKKIVWAETRNESKAQATIDGCYGYDSFLDAKWIDIRVRRYKELDGMENATPIEVMRQLINLGWWFEVDGIKYDKDNPLPVL